MATIQEIMAKEDFEYETRGSSEDFEYESEETLDDVPGAGVNPEKVRVPRKRLKNAFRKYCEDVGGMLSFKEYCRTVALSEADEKGSAEIVDYFAKKKSSYHRAAKNARKDRVRTKALERKRRPVEEPSNNRKKRR